MRFLALLLLLPGPAHADDPPPVAVEVRQSGPPFRYVVTLRPERELEVLADRRLLSFELRPLGEPDRRARRVRPVVCRMPGAPSRVSPGRIRRVSPSEPWQEWIDVREACWGRALSALGAGARVTARYGFSRAGRDRWIAREGETRWHSIEMSFERQALAPPPALPPSPLDVRLSPGDASSGRSLVFRVSVRSSDAPTHVYSRPDHWSFRVRGPLGEVTCAIEPGGGSPPVDLFRRVSRRAAVAHSLTASTYCPPETFALDGIYEVQPVVDLPHSGEEWGLHAATGRFRGPYAPVRIRGSARGYVERAVPAERPATDG